MFPNDMLSSLWALRPCVHHIKSNNAYTETKAFTLLLKKQATLSNKQLSSKKKSLRFTTETNLCKSISILHVKKTITYCVSYRLLQLPGGC